MEASVPSKSAASTELGDGSGISGTSPLFMGIKHDFSNRQEEVYAIRAPPIVGDGIRPNLAFLKLADTLLTQASELGHGVVGPSRPCDM